MDELRGYEEVVSCLGGPQSLAKTEDGYRTPLTVCQQQQHDDDADNDVSAAPNGTAYTRLSCLSGLANHCANNVDTSRPQNDRFLAIWPYGPSEWLTLPLIRAGDVKTNSGPTTTRKQVLICDICRSQIYCRKEISIR